MKNFIILLLLLLSLQARGGRLENEYIKSFQVFMKACSMHYTIGCTYPDGSTSKISGMVVNEGKNFYDSSNLRMVLCDKSWYLNIDHSSKTASILNLGTLSQKALDKINNNKTYFLSEEDINKKMTTSVLRETHEQIVLKFRFKETKMINELNITFNKATKKPISYNLTFNYPAGYSDNVSNFIKMDIVCFDMSDQISATIFDHTRLIVPNGKTAKLKKFLNYETFFYNVSGK